MWQGQDAVLSLWLAVKNKTVMADAKASMRPRTSLIYHNARGALYHLSVRLITELKHFVNSDNKLTTTQRGGRLSACGNPLSSENSEQRHVAESISNAHPVFRHTPGFMFCQCCKQKKKRLRAGQFLEINQLLVRDLLHQNVKSSASPTEAGCMCSGNERCHI